MFTTWLFMDIIACKLSYMCLYFQNIDGIILTIASPKTTLVDTAFLAKEDMLLFFVSFWFHELLSLNIYIRPICNFIIWYKRMIANNPSHFYPYLLHLLRNSDMCAFVYIPRLFEVLADDKLQWVLELKDVFRCAG